MKKPNILIGSCCHRNQVTLSYTHSLIGTIREFAIQGLGSEWYTIVGDSIVHRARNLLAAKTLSKPFTHILSVDDDMGWNPKDVIRWLLMDKPIVCAAYPARIYEWRKLREIVKQVHAAGEFDPDTFDFEHAGLLTTANLKRDGATHCGAVEALAAGTGMMLIKREVFETMIDKRENLKINAKLPGREDLEPHYFNFFEYGRHPKSNAVFGEDYNFCYQAALLGFPIFVDPNCSISHVGDYIYTSTPGQFTEEGFDDVEFH